MNITELARQLKITTNELLEILPELGFHIGAKAIKVNDSLVDKIKLAYIQYKKKIRFQEEESKIKEIKINDKKETNQKHEKIIHIEENIIVKDLAEKMNMPINKLMTELMKNGIMISLNSTMDYDTASIIAEDLGFKVEKITNEKKEIERDIVKIKKLEELLEKDSKKSTRPPVVVVMGHVDHGKTKLLDTIRTANVIDTESGNITQHIGAYQTELNGKKITFLDTPGHEAFKGMRSRGAKIADIGIIVIAADEGLKPQTIESIELVQEENIPFIIAINKIDKPEADIEKTKTMLSEINLIPEDWGGKTICVPISAKKGENIKELLEMINLLADMENLQADTQRKAIGTIIESNIDKNLGPIATVLIQTGTLNIGDEFIVGNISGKVKSMIDYRGAKITEAGPSTPVQVLGFKGAPSVGDIFNADIEKNEYKNIKKRAIKTFTNTTAKTQESDDDETQLKLNIILKSDVIGSKEAIEDSIKKISKPGVSIKIVKNGLGNITDKDILDAESTNSIILGFHVKTNANAELMAKEKNIEIKIYTIIYKLLEDLEVKIDKMVIPQMIREQVGEGLVLRIFKTLPKKMVVGLRITKGKIMINTLVKVIRAGEVIAVGKITNLQSGKENVNEVSYGQECGVEFTGEPIIKTEDILEFYTEKK
ncbi:MAG TPA: translation initiation factor IF-2 [bacterium]|jgi:translation initiation factor IF-2|nr:translation initiation factor IF-2 [bacterium]HOG38384.1 translation initiation factor IF-2 [bacterium]HQI03342.1 translation initiation factor IF-2 [bacterium]